MAETWISDTDCAAAPAEACLTDTPELDCQTTADRCATPGTPVEPPTLEPGPCQHQADGRDLCEPVEPGITCPQAVPAVDASVDDPATIDCTPPVPPDAGDPGGVPLPEPEPPAVQIELLDAEEALLALDATDGSAVLYLVPAYRFTTADGGVVDLPAVADEALVEPTTTAPPSTAPPDTVATTQPTTTTTTVGAVEVVPLAPGETPEIGVPYYVDVSVLGHCGFISVELAGTWWWADGLELDRWATPTEGGRLVLVADDEAEFTGDAAETKTATLHPFTGPGDRPLCD